MGKVHTFLERQRAYQQAAQPGGETTKKAKERRRTHRRDAERSIELAKETSDRAWATLEAITPRVSKHSTLGRYAHAGHGILPPPEQRG